ncbi:MAG TPA: ATP-binding cassette domain-containing protein [Streptosporangiaceae bacterium]|jgi:D-xylose transport system ATP-binding protein|nr:ATP-binding cassette domain-containing protein [Streptosporangiaceae bacterium]
MSFVSADDGRPADGASLLALRAVSKSFGAVQALSGIDLEVHASEVVALLGDNGAGKSTLVKLLSGVFQPDAGTITFRGRPVTIASPAQSRALGIATVYQDLALCDNLDVVANLFLGQETSRLATLSEEQMESRTWTVLRQLSAKIPSVRVPVAGLSGGQRQTVAIARALVGDPAVVILDEPTAALGVEQTAEILNLVERLRENGHGVLVITHNLADVQEVANRAVVLRLGRNNGVFSVAGTSQQDIVSAITGASESSVTRRAAVTAARRASKETSS